MEKNSAVNQHFESSTHKNELDKARTRNLWVDYAKAIGIILVVYGHVARGVFSADLNLDRSIYELVDSVIYSFHMPLFFFLSGIFFLASIEKRDSLSLLRIKVDTILYPYVVWSLVQGMIEVALSQYVNGHPSMGDVLSLIWFPRAQFWFLYILFFVFALAILTYRKSNLNWRIGIFAGSIFLYFLGWQSAGGFLINMLSHYFVYFSAGVLATLAVTKFKDIEPRWLVLILALFLSSQWIFHVGMGLRYDTNSTAAILALGLISIAFIVVLAQWLTRYNLRWLAFLGRHSMTIYLLHILAGSGSRIVLHKVFGITDVGIHLLIGTAGGLLLPLLIYFGCTRFGMGALFSPPKLLSIGRR